MLTTPDLIATSKDLTAFADSSENKILSALARKLAGYFMFLAHAGEEEVKAALEADIAEDHAKFTAEVMKLRAAGGQ